MMKKDLTMTGCRFCIDEAGQEMKSNGQLTNFAKGNSSLFIISRAVRSKLYKAKHTRKRSTVHFFSCALVGRSVSACSLRHVVTGENCRKTLSNASFFV
ncbi:hypothetical protein L596_026944 [Steinernema carpocapsae]|uniref:Uncharacterized protein n=1 Tax=Steinernema carpocapsae TaxID=34508 RepID=A0A4U5M3S5_STECR|nr:hypothetical protein L596_026944 [Steinernema carpocapsae]